jgi:hypothetical protein
MLTPDQTRSLRPSVIRRLLPVAGLLLLALSVLLAAPAAAQDTTNRLVVLEPRLSVSEGYSRSDLKYLSDQIRRGALEATRGSSWEVMARENMETFARANDIDLQACEEGSLCEVDVGRAMQAQAVVAFDATQFGTKLTVTIKLFNTVTGKTIGIEEVRKSTKDELAEQVTSEAEALVREGLGMGRSSRRRGPDRAPAEEGSIGESSSSFSVGSTVQEEIVNFQSTPAGAVVLVDGGLLCASTPCSKYLRLGSHRVEMQADRYHPASDNIRVKSGMSAVAFDLEATFALLTVTTEPPGLAFLINDKKVGEEGLQRREFAPGSYDLKLNDQCYLRSGQRVVLQEGQDRTVQLDAKRRRSGLRVDVEDARGNALAGQVWVDDKNLGAAPGPFELSYCAQKVEVRTQNHGNWSQELALVEDQIATLRAVLTRTSNNSPPPRSARADAQQAGRIVVLELQSSGEFSRAELNRLSVQLRYGALTATRGSGYEVMSRTDMVVLAGTMEIDLAACQEGTECEVDIGRNIGAALVVSGYLSIFGRQGMGVRLLLHDAAKGSLLAERTTRAANKDELFDALPAAANELFRLGLGLGEATGSSVARSYDTNYLANLSGKAKGGSLSTAELRHLKACQPNDPNFKRAYALLVLHYDKKGDKEAHCMTARTVLGHGRYRYDPEWNLQGAKCSLRKGDWDEAMSHADTTLSNQNLLSVSGDGYFGGIARAKRVLLAYQIKAKALTMKYEVNAKNNAGFGDIRLLNSAVSAWLDVRNHAFKFDDRMAAERARLEVEDLEARRGR